MGPGRWGIDGARKDGRGLAQHLVACGETVYEGHPRWTALGRHSAHTKSDPLALDAHAGAMLGWREGETLPRVAAEEETASLALLVTEREGALVEATRLRNPIPCLLLQLDPESRSHLPHRQPPARLAALASYTPPHTSGLAQRLRRALDHAKELAAQIRTRARRFFPTRLCGINRLTAGALAGILGPGRRCASDARLAAYAGVAPLEASSAGWCATASTVGAIAGSTQSCIGSP